MELQSIYRTYRPQKWAHIVGQPLIVRTLTNEIAHDTLVHAYLFTGMRGVGKTTTARLLAKTVNCQKRAKGEVEPCNTCDACVAVTLGRSLDVMEIDAASHTGVDNVRENVIAASRVASFERAMKVFIIDEVHMLSTAAFNALLKTLEEPSPNVLFILATTDSDRIPETIISRCQRFDFRRVTKDDVEKRLKAIAESEGVSVAPEVLALVVRGSGGSLRDAESMLGQLVGLGKKKITKEDAALLLPQGDEEQARTFVSLLLGHDSAAALTLADALGDRGVDVRLFIDDCIAVTRDALISGIRGDKNASPLSASQETYAGLLRRLFEASREVASVDPPALVLELLIAEYGSTAYASAPVASVGVSSDVVARAGRASKKEEKQKKEIEKNETPNAASTNTTLSLIDIHREWHRVLTTAKKHNHSLALVLKVATPIAVETGVLTLGFRYSFHADRLEGSAIKNIACRIFEEVFSLPLTLRTRIVTGDDSTSPSSSPPRAPEKVNALLTDLLSTFGGKVVQKSEG